LVFVVFTFLCWGAALTSFSIYSAKSANAANYAIAAIFAFSENSVFDPKNMFKQIRQAW
jgi:hypothetical protein